MTRRALAIVAASAALLACATEGPSASEGAVRAERRRLVTQPLFVTSTDNRVVDPELSELAHAVASPRWTMFVPAANGPTSSTVGCSA